MRSIGLLRFLVPLLIAGCASPSPIDRTAYLGHFPRSILVLPPLDETLETEACAGSLASITRPLAERGYYVFPVAMVDLMMRENGLPTPFEMHQVSLQKLKEVFDPDAVLYLKVTQWGTSYQVVNSVSRVAVQGRLVDVDSGQEIWASAAVAKQDSSSGQSGLIGMLASALVSQIVNDIADPSRSLSSRASWGLIGDERTGLLYGAYHPMYEESLAAANEEMARQRGDG